MNNAGKRTYAAVAVATAEMPRNGSDAEAGKHNSVPATIPEKSEVSGGEALMRCLVAEGVDTIFGYPGGAIMPVYDALFDYREQINHVLVRHEQGATHAAEGYAWMTGKAGVCMATSGPGATNLITGLADAMLDSVPLVCITGQVPGRLLGTDAFQETDVISVSHPVTKWNYQITNPDEIPEVMAKAFHIAQTGRPGPVLVDITKDSQLGKLSKPFNYKAYKPTREEPHGSTGYTSASTSYQYRTAAGLINNARRPYLLFGHGVLISRAQDQLLDFVEKTGIPAASTLLGLSALPSDHPQYVGMLGMHGNYGANVLTNSCDVLIAVGMRFDDRVTGDLSRYAKQAKVIHIDIDPAEIDKNVPTTVGIVADAKEALLGLMPIVQPNDHSKWVQEFRKYDIVEKERVISDDLYPEDGHLKMGEVVRLISEHSEGKAVVVADVGQHQMVAARYSKFFEPHSWITSGGLGTMGFALPAAFGAKAAAKDRPVVAVIGDGGFQMTIQELGTVAQTGLPVKIVILNNGYLGMVRQWQELFFDNRYSFVELENPDFIAISKGFGIEAVRVTSRDDIDGAVKEMLDADIPYLLEVVVEKEENIFPMMPVGASVEDVILEPED